MPLGSLVPRGCAGWTTQGEDSQFTQEGIYKYMDGAGELYREYEYRELFVRRFHHPSQPPITVELFDMGTPALAFGVFSHTRDGPDAGVGQGADYRAGLLCFWKGRYFVCIRAGAETPMARQAVFQLGSAIANAINETGIPPNLLDALPSRDLIEQNVRYFRTHTCLNYHYFISDDNVLRLGAHTEAVLAPYRQSGGRCYLLLVKYPSAEMAKAALESFLHEKKMTTPFAQTGDGKWLAAIQHGELLAIVLDAATKKLATDLITSVRR